MNLLQKSLSQLRRENYYCEVFTPLAMANFLPPCNVDQYDGLFDILACQDRGPLTAIKAVLPADANGILARWCGSIPLRILLRNAGMRVELWIWQKSHGKDGQWNVTRREFTAADQLEILSALDNLADSA